MTFSTTFFSSLVYGAIGLATLAVITLLVLLFRDFIKGRIW